MAGIRKKHGRLNLQSLKSVARFPIRMPVRVSYRRGGSHATQPAPGELPIVILRVQILACHNLIAGDLGGTSDPFVVLSLARIKKETPVVKKSLNPVYNAKDATFDFPVYLSLVGKMGVLELIVWDKDMIKRDYLGEASLHLEDWFRDGLPKGFNDNGNTPFPVPLASSRASKAATGSIIAKLGFVHPETRDHSLNFDEIYDELLLRAREARTSLMSVPPTEGIGTVHGHGLVPEFEDDGLTTDDDYVTDDGGEDVEEFGDPGTQPADASSPMPIERISRTPPLATPDLNVIAPSPVHVSSIPTTVPAVPTPSPFLKPHLGSKLPRVFKKRSNPPTPTPLVTPQTSLAVSHSPSPSPTNTTPLATPHPSKKHGFRHRWRSNGGDYNLNVEHDIAGIVMLEVQQAVDLPRWKNMTRLGWDMDPFVVISFGKKVFRTRVIRHSLNPVWDEKLLFPVRNYEVNFKVQLTVLDWDKLSSNDFVGDASFDISELLKYAPKKDEVTGLYPETDMTQDMCKFEFSLNVLKDVPQRPVLTIRARYQPYDALRQQFWRHFLKQYTTDDSNSVSRIELTSMLDSLGSTLSGGTIRSWFVRHGKDPKEGHLTLNEAVQCLELEVCRPSAEKKRIVLDDAGHQDTSSPPTPSYPTHEWLPPLALESINFAEPAAYPMVLLPQFSTHAPRQTSSGSDSSSGKENTSEHLQTHQAKYPTGPTHTPLPAPSSAPITPPTSDAEDWSSGGATTDDALFERVINVKNCPLCHRPRLKKRAEVDIVTHLAVCASQDWSRVDHIVVNNFVTASQAQRKWYTRIVSKISAGDYKLGANSANIIVQNRMTGQLEEEKMQVYVRLGIRLLYKGASSRMEGARARRLLKSLSIKQGAKYDSPASANEIPAFIQFHNLNVNEILEPIESFETFNKFFYRKLRPGARPVDSPDDPTRLVSGADCRMMAFETVSEATRLWIKGREFSVARLLGEAYRCQAERYMGGALCIFRLAPQDYHRFHSPVDGRVGRMTYIHGEYYTVNPQAIRTALDVYGENARKIVPINSPIFGRVMAVCIGAMMVGSIKTTVQEGDEVHRGQEFGYFAFGGSTIVCLFEKGVVEWDEDLLVNGRASLETLVRVGMGIGRARRAPPPPPVTLPPPS